jgi:hypothetical protein
MDTLFWILVLYLFIGGLVTALYLYDIKRSSIVGIKLSKADVKEALEIGFIGTPALIIVFIFHVVKALLLAATFLLIVAFILYCIYQITN